MPPTSATACACVSNQTACAALRAALAFFKSLFAHLTQSLQGASAAGGWLASCAAMRATRQPFKQALHQDWCPSGRVAFFAKLLNGNSVLQRVHVLHGSFLLMFFPPLVLGGGAPPQIILTRPST